MRSAEKVKIEISLPAHFNYKTREQILAMRTRQVMKYPGLLAANYEPYNPIWGAIEDKKPWWGLAGAAVYDSGSRSMLGFAEESRFVMNPYLLVAANPGVTGIWHRGLITERQINDPTFPFFWQPQSLTIDPAKSLGTVSYNLTEYNEKTHATGMLANQAFIKKFSLVAYNARDFGYNYIYFCQEKSINVVNDNPSFEASFIRQMIHCGGTCGCPGTCCNNMSPFMASIDRLHVSKLPARGVVYLWKEDPGDVSKAPDMVFLLEFH